MEKKSTHFWHWLPAIIWMAVIFYFSSLPNLQSGLPTAWDMILRKAAHIFEYLVLTLLIWLGLRPTKLFRFNKLQIVFILAWLYALSDEWHQSFVPTRDGNLFDVGIDSIGIVIGIIILMRLAKK